MICAEEASDKKIISEVNPNSEINVAPCSSLSSISEEMKNLSLDSFMPGTPELFEHAILLFKMINKKIWAELEELGLSYSQKKMIVEYVSDMIKRNIDEEETKKSNISLKGLPESDHSNHPNEPVGEEKHLQEEAERMYQELEQTMSFLFKFLSKDPDKKD